MVGADRLDARASPRARIGHWLAKPYGNQGLMTDAVRRFVDPALAKLQDTRLTTEVFARSGASARVLHKEEFVQEGRLRRPRNNGGKRLDVLYFGLLNADLDDA